VEIIWIAKVLLHSLNGKKCGNRIDERFLIW